MDPVFGPCQVVGLLVLQAVGAGEDVGDDVQKGSLLHAADAGEDIEPAAILQTADADDLGGEDPI